MNVNSDVYKSMKACNDNLDQYSEDVSKLLEYIEERDEILLSEEQKLIEAE